MNEHERREEAIHLVEKTYAGGAKNLDTVMDELSSMSAADRRDVIKKMEAIDKKCHEDTKTAQELHLPTIQIIDRETSGGHVTIVKTSMPAEHSKDPQEKKKH